MEIDQQKVKKISQILKEKGETWVIAAMIESSIGYHTPSHAKILIERFKAREYKDYCERCAALYNGNLVNMMHKDITYFEYLEESKPEKVQRLQEFVEKAIKLDPIQQSTISLLWPTHRI